MSSLVVNQIYGPVWQGEGPSAGVYASVIRLMGCNLSCNWRTEAGYSKCDEAQTWDAENYDLHKEGIRLEAAEIALRAMLCSPRLVMLTGGEPLLHQTQPGWEELLFRLDGSWEHDRPRIEVETNGTQLPSGPWIDIIDQFNVSPKLQSSGMPHINACKPKALEWFAASGRAVFKFVVTREADLDEVAEWAETYRLPRDRIWVMPAGTTRDEVLGTSQALARAILRRRLNLTLRQHVLVFEEEGEPRG